jgi:endo-1,4-beta-xylanase
MARPRSSSVTNLAKDISGASWPTIREAAAAHGIDFGMAVQASQLSDSVTGLMVANECSVIIPEYQMQMSVMQPVNTILNPNGWNFAAMDTIAAFAAAHNMKLHGHAGVFHNTDLLPQWAEDILAVPNEANCRTLITNRLEGLFARYTFDTFQAFNEVLGTAGGYRTTSPWYIGWGGIGYVEFTCQEVRRLSPTTKIIGNDYAFEYAASTGNDAKRAQALVLAADLKGKGVLDGFGCQTHVQAAASYQSSLEHTFRPWMASMRALGTPEAPFLVPLTEVDFLNQVARATDEELDAYASDRVRRIVATWAEGLQSGEQLVVWGIKDDLSWLQDPANRPGFEAITQQRPLPWDSNGNPKTMERMYRRIFSPPPT